MLTYVINTSENKTFDSDLLFELSGYSKIRWMHCRLDEVEECAKEISVKQNILGAEKFRVAVLVDFYGFDRIRRPYGCGGKGYGEETGIDLCLYYPYIETYLVDHLFDYLETRNLHAATREVYYIQNENADRYSFINNREEQLRQVISPSEPESADEEPEIPEDDNSGDVTPLDKVSEGVEINADADGAAEVNGTEEANGTSGASGAEDAAGAVVAEDEPRYPSFDLHCTPEVSLTFRLFDYPYCGSNTTTLGDFIRRFADRTNERSHIFSHVYVTSYGEGDALAAFDTLALSLYLIRMYEREELRDEKNSLQIDHLDPNKVREILQRAWNKIHKAQELARENQCEYYSLNIGNGDRVIGETESEEEHIKSEMPKVSPEQLRGECRALFEQICQIAGGGQKMTEAEATEMDKVIEKYLGQRDELREDTVRDDLSHLVDGSKKIKQCPSQLDYEAEVNKRYGQISALFRRTLKAEYLQADYETVYKKAQDAYDEYQKLARRRSRWIVADVLMLLITVGSMALPFHYLQQINTPALEAFLQGTAVIAPFAGLFFMIFVGMTATINWRIRAVQDVLCQCLRECIARRNYKLSALRQRYEADLPEIEKVRYEIRGIGSLHEKNMDKIRNVRRHRQTLESVENRLSAMLNNLGVEPVPDKNENITCEFDIQKPIRSADNKVYRVFSVETIEAMFDKKGGAQK